MVLWAMVLDPMTTSMTAFLNIRPSDIQSGAEGEGMTQIARVRVGSVGLQDGTKTWTNHMWTNVR